MSDNSNLIRLMKLLDDNKTEINVGDVAFTNHLDVPTDAIGSDVGVEYPHIYNTICIFRESPSSPTEVIITNPRGKCIKRFRYEDIDSYKSSIWYKYKKWKKNADLSDIVFFGIVLVACALIFLSIIILCFF